MSTARKIIDWHGQDPAELARELAALPRGRYVLVLESELGEEVLSAEDEAAVEAGLDDIERGSTVPWERVRADLEATIAAVRSGRAQ
jgi:hypothetical protein